MLAQARVLGDRRWHGVDRPEQTFEYIQMRGAAADLQELQRRVQRMQGTVVSRTLESLPGLSDLIQLRTGAAYAVDSASLALALLAGPSQAGEWVGIVGATDLGF